MNGVPTQRAASQPTATAPTRPKRPRRWHRAAIPFAVLALLYLVTGVAHAVQEPDFDDPGTLAPTGTGPDGASRIADLLAARGVTISRAASSGEARATLDTLGDGQRATIFVPAPHLVDRRFLADLARDPAGHRVVLLRPGARIAYLTGLYPGFPRWAAARVSPGCTAEVATSAGRAAVRRSSYGVDPDDLVFSCYQGGLVAIRSGATELVGVGATDPFRNSRVGEVGNAALATGLLGRDRQLVWLDLHQAEPQEEPPPPDFSLPEYDQPDRGPGSGGDPTWAAFPPVLWATLLVLAMLGLLVAVVRGRRLGPPVAEPLPAVVPATETVVGRGRLYQRVRAHQETFDTLRAAAVRRIAPTLAPAGPFDDAASSTAASAGPGETDRSVPALDLLVGQIAARAGIPAAQVWTIVCPASVATDEELANAVTQLDALVAAVLRAGTRPGPEPRSEPTRAPQLRPESPPAGPDTPDRSVNPGGNP